MNQQYYNQEMEDPAKRKRGKIEAEPFPIDDMEIDFSNLNHHFAVDFSTDVGTVSSPIPYFEEQPSSTPDQEAFPVANGSPNMPQQPSKPQLRLTKITTKKPDEPDPSRLTELPIITSKTSKTEPTHYYFHVELIPEYSIVSVSSKYQINGSIEGNYQITTNSEINGNTAKLWLKVQPSGTYKSIYGTKLTVWFSAFYNTHSGLQEVESMDSIKLFLCTKAEQRNKELERLLDTKSPLFFFFEGLYKEIEAFLPVRRTGPEREIFISQFAEDAQKFYLSVDSKQKTMLDYWKFIFDIQEREARLQQLYLAFCKHIHFVTREQSEQILGGYLPKKNSPGTCLFRFGIREPGIVLVFISPEPKAVVHRKKDPISTFIDRPFTSFLALDGVRYSLKGNWAVNLKNDLRKIRHMTEVEMINMGYSNV